MKNVFPSMRAQNNLSYKTNKTSQTAKGNNISSIDAVESFKMKYRTQNTVSHCFK